MGVNCFDEYLILYYNKHKDIHTWHEKDQNTM